MDKIRTAVAVFCIACICAELVAQLVGDVRSKQGIKAAAGLYILLAVSNALPRLDFDPFQFAVPQSAQADLGGTEDAILLETQRQLEARLEAEVADATGVEIELSLTLARSGQEVSAEEARVTLPPGCTDEACARIQEILSQELGLGEVQLAAGEGSE